MCLYYLTKHISKILCNNKYDERRGGIYLTFSLSAELKVVLPHITMDRW